MRPIFALGLRREAFARPLGQAREHVAGREAELLENRSDGTIFGGALLLPRAHEAVSGELGHDATEAPDVNGTRVLLAAEKHLGRSPPKGLDGLGPIGEGDAKPRIGLSGRRIPMAKLRALNLPIGKAMATNFVIGPSKGPQIHHEDMKSSYLAMN